MIVYAKTTNPMLKQFINEALKDNVTRIRVYDSSEEFWKHVSRKTPTLVIFDIRNASNSQLYNIKKVRKHSLLSFRRAPILAVADQISDDKIIETLAMGADDVLTSPFSPEMLVARLEAIGRRAERQTRNLAEKKLRY
ncbi:MAG: response regulator, partial [Bifidobacteriaceae bacterium]|nr:response regulator [Bifidobacteriaceae bacterium]